MTSPPRCSRRNWRRSRASARLRGRKLASRGSRGGESAAAVRSTTWVSIRSARFSKAPMRIDRKARWRIPSAASHLCSDQLFLAKDYKDLVVVYRNGAPVRLSDLGRVVDANEDVRNSAWSTAVRWCRSRSTGSPTRTSWRRWRGLKP